MKSQFSLERVMGLQAQVGGKAPLLYQVVLQNDDFTPMEFVVNVLEAFFYMDRSKAVQVMMNAHVHGKAACGCFTKDVAEMKIIKTSAFAKTSEHPLVFKMELA